jgi:TRAP-type C4-dicarboxylate transport system permease small subunit
MEKAYAIWRALQDRVLGRIAALLLLGCTLLALVEIFRRYILGFSYEWQSDAVTFFILSGVYLYFSISQHQGEHLGVTIVLEVLEAYAPRAPRAAVAAEVIKVIALVISFLFLLAVVWWGIPEVRDSYSYETRTESLAFPMWPFLAVLLTGFAFMAITIFFQIYRGIHKLRGRTVLEDKAESEGALHLTR